MYFDNVFGNIIGIELNWIVAELSIFPFVIIGELFGFDGMHDTNRLVSWEC